MRTRHSHVLLIRLRARVLYPGGHFIKSIIIIIIILEWTSYREWGRVLNWCFYFYFVPSYFIRKPSVWLMDVTSAKIIIIIIIKWHKIFVAKVDQFIFVTVETKRKRSAQKNCKHGISRLNWIFIPVELATNKTNIINNNKQN